MARTSTLTSTSSRHILNIFVTLANNDVLILKITQHSDNVTSNFYNPKNNFNLMHIYYHYGSVIYAVCLPSFIKEGQELIKIDKENKYNEFQNYDKSLTK